MLQRILFLLFLLSAPLLGAITRGPYLTQVAQNSIVISWKTDSSQISLVDYGKTLNYGFQFSGTTLSIDHSIVLTDLAPSTEYHYRIVGKDSSDDFTFTTTAQPGQPFTFAVYGDTRTNHAAHESVLVAIIKTHPRFALHTGDLVSSSTEENWEKYFEIFCKRTKFGQTIPFFPVMGNHDSKSSLYYDVFSLPHNNPDNTESYCSFDYGSAHFIALNTTTDYSDTSAQNRWLVQDLIQAQSARFRFVFFHSPAYSSSNHGSTGTVQQFLCPIFEKYKVDMVFAGHDHNYERTKPINGVTYVVTGGGGAPLYNPKGENSWTAYKESVYHFCKIAVGEDQCDFSMIRVDGSVGDRMVLKARQKRN